MGVLIQIDDRERLTRTPLLYGHWITPKVDCVKQQHTPPDLGSHSAFDKKKPRSNSDIPLNSKKKT